MAARCSLRWESPISRLSRSERPRPPRSTCGASALPAVPRLVGCAASVAWRRCDRQVDGKCCQIAIDLVHRGQQCAPPLIERVPIPLALPFLLPFEVAAQIFQGSLQRVHRERQEQLGRVLHWLVPHFDLASAELRRLREERPCSDQGQLQRLQGIDAVRGFVDRRRQTVDPESAGPLACGNTDRGTDFDIDFAAMPCEWTPDVLAPGDAASERNRRVSRRYSSSSAPLFPVLHGEIVRQALFSRAAELLRPPYSSRRGESAIRGPDPRS